MLTLAGLLVAIGCEQIRTDPASQKITSDDVRRDVGQADKTTAAFVEQTKEEYQQQLDARLKKLDAQIAALHEKGRDLKDEAKANWERKLPELQAKQDSAHAKLAEVQKSSAEAWKDMKQGAQAAWDDLNNAFRDASRQF
jgi:predicted ribosome quality control (RQC) complex YloA/Tae2 family protein